MISLMVGRDADNAHLRRPDRGVHSNAPSRDKVGEDDRKHTRTTRSRVADWRCRNARYDRNGPAFPRVAKRHLPANDFLNKAPRQPCLLPHLSILGLVMPPSLLGYSLNSHSQKSSTAVYNGQIAAEARNRELYPWATMCVAMTRYQDDELMVRHKISTTSVMHRTSSSAQCS